MESWASGVLGGGAGGDTDGLDDIESGGGGTDDTDGLDDIEGGGGSTEVFAFAFTCHHRCCRLRLVS